MARKSKKVLIKSRIVDASRSNCSIGTAVLLSWDIDAEAELPVYFVTTDERGSFEIELARSNESKLWIRVAPPWSVCPNVFESTTWYRVDIENSSDFGELLSDGTLRIEIPEIEALPQRLHSFICCESKR